MLMVVAGVEEVTEVAAEADMLAVAVISVVAIALVAVVIAGVAAEAVVLAHGPHLHDHHPVHHDRLALLGLQADLAVVAVVAEAHTVANTHHDGPEIVAVEIGMAAMVGEIVEDIGGVAAGGSGGADGGIHVHHSGVRLAMDAGGLTIAGTQSM